MNIETIIGLVGVTLAITVGGVIDELRGWLVGFAVPYNPLRVLGNMLSSTMIVGFFCGALWAAFARHDPALSGGVVAMASAVADEGLALLHGLVRRVMPYRPPQPMPMPIEIPAKTRAPKNEDEAHDEMDRRDAEREG
jgi:hypothetical protein